MSIIEVKVPDIGDFKDVEVIELMVKPGDRIVADQSLVMVESDKASMEIPSSHGGTIKEMKVKIGDKISEGAILLTLDTEEGGAATSVPQAAPQLATAPASAPAAPAATASRSLLHSIFASPPAQPQQATPVPSSAPAAPIAPPLSAFSPIPAPAPLPPAQILPVVGTNPHASPSIRKFARELGVDLNRVPATGPKGRILREDVQNHVKTIMSGAATAPVHPSSGLDLLPWPSLDFSKFGPTEVVPLSRIKKISGPNLHRNWVMIPHVTQYEDADVTELEALRQEVNETYKKDGVRVTILAFVIKACVAALKKFPQFNSSLDEAGENLIVKNYWHIGFAADTVHGLVVPVIRDADQKGVLEIAREMAELSAHAREGKLNPTEIQGATFTITSLGGIGGTYFTPLINAPEVAIVGLSRLRMTPTWNGKEFVPRLILPLSLSYDHRVIDGAEGTRFTAYLAEVLGDMRKTLL